MRYGIIPYKEDELEMLSLLNESPLVIIDYYCFPYNEGEYNYYNTYSFFVKNSVNEFKMKPELEPGYCLRYNEVEENKFNIEIIEKVLNSD